MQCVHSAYTETVYMVNLDISVQGPVSPKALLAYVVCEVHRTIIRVILKSIVSNERRENPRSSRQLSTLTRVKRTNV